MSDRSRDFGFLRPKERAYLSEQEHYLGRIDEESPKRPAQTKSRIKNEVVKNLDQAIDDFARDLMAVSNFQRRESTVQEQFVWEGATLEFAKPELERLKRTIDRLLEQAESLPVSSERKELQEVLNRLYEGTDLEHPSKSDKNLSPEELEELYHRQREMNKHLKTVLSKEELPEILSYIGEHGKCELSGRTIGENGEPWPQVASRELVPELATKDDTWGDHKEYELTEKGEAVLECWEELQQTKTIQIQSDLRPEQTPREVVLKTLAEHFPKNYSG